MTQEEFTDVKGMRAAGMTYAEIAEQTGYHRTTLAKWATTGGPPDRRAPAADRAVLTDRWRRSIGELLEPPADVAIRVDPRPVSRGGVRRSYAMVVREARRKSGCRFRAATAASVPIETAAGAEAQLLLRRLV